MRLNLTSIKFTLSMLLCVLGMQTFAQISGRVFRDNNGNGLRDSSLLMVEPYLSGITVTAFPSSGASQTTTTAASTGAYSFTGLTLPIRIEFSGWSASQYSTASSTNSKTSVQFYTAASTTANFGLLVPEFYCQDNPQIAVAFTPGTTNFVSGSTSPSGIRSYPLSGLTTATNEAGTTGIVIMPSTSIATAAQVGNVQGIKWRKSSKTLFSSAYARANDGTMGASDGIGPAGLGGIYQINGTTVSTFATVTNVGSFTGAMSEVGKVGLGGLTLSTHGDSLFTINMFAKTLVIIPINDNPVSAGTQVQVPLPQPSNATAAQTHPFAIAAHGNKVFIGMVCGGPTTADLRGYVYSYDGSNFNLELDFPLNYTRTNNPDGNNTNNLFNEINHSFIEWQDNPTVSAYDNTTPSTATDAARFAPMLTDIVFQGDNMVLGFRSRLSDQIVNSEWTIGGELLHACASTVGSTTTWTLENNGSCGGNTTINPPPVTDPWASTIAARATSKGPGGYEYYWGDNGFEGEMVQGGLSIYPGSNVFFTSQIDAIGHRSQHGLAAINYTTGAMVLAGNTAQARYNLSSTNRAMKSNQMGDIEVLCNDAPIEIGNRIWNDINKDGIQDANEPVLVGVTVQLYDSVGVLIPGASVVTSSTGEYIFSSASGTSTANIIYNLAINPNTKYALRVTNLGSNASVTGLNLTDITPLTLAEPDSINSGNSLSNNDAVLVSNIPTIRFYTGEFGENNHTYDFGFACNQPILNSFTYGQATCPGNGITPNNNATVQISSNGDKAAISATGIPATTYAAASTLSSGSFTFSNQNGATTSFYLRIFKGPNCWLDTTLSVTPSRCCPTISNITTPATGAEFCSGTKIPSFNVTTNAIATDSIRLVYFTSKQTDPSIIYNNGTFLAQKVITGTSTGISNTANFTNIQLPTVTGLSFDTLWIYAMYIDQTGDTTCQIFKEKAIKILSQPVPHISANTMLCNSSTMVLSSDNAASYKWGIVGSTTVSSTTKTYSVTPPINATTTYWLVTTNSFPCTSDTAYHTVTTSGGVNGSVFQDFNSNGTKDANETYGIPNVTVNAYDNAGTIVATATTDPSGNYSFPSLTASSGKVRIEFVKSTLPSGFIPSFAGSSNGTDVQFVTAPSCNVNLGVYRVTNYCQTDPFFAVVRFMRNSDPNTNNVITMMDTLSSKPFTPALATDGNRNWAIPFDYSNANYPIPAQVTIANTGNVGTTFGLGWNKQQKKLFTGAYMRAYADMGANSSSNGFGEGVIYQVPINGVNVGTPNVWLDLETMFGDGFAGTYIADGAYPGPAVYGRTGSNPNKIGYTGLGSIKISDDGKQMYVVNLNNREVLVIPIDSATGAAPSSAASIKRFKIPSTDAPGFWPDGRPYMAVLGLGVHPLTGRVFTTVTNTGPTLANLKGYVYSFDPNDNTPDSSDFVKELEIPMNIVRPATNPNVGNWYDQNNHVWESVTANNVFYPNSVSSAQEMMPWLGEIIFDLQPNGQYGMVIGERNRYHDIINSSFYVTGGVIYRVTANGSNWILEHNGSAAPYNSVVNWSNNSTTTAGNFTSSSNRFFKSVGAEGSFCSGTISHIHGSKEIILPTMDNVYYSGTSGISWMNTNTGDRSRNLRLVSDGTGAGYNSVPFTKSNNFGDIEVLCSEAPLQIGNYVWKDSDADGVQDPNENPISNILVTLWKGNTQLASTTTNSNGEYYFSKSGVQGVTWSGTGADTMLLPNTIYQVRIQKNTQPAIDSLQLTIQNSSLNVANDQNDNDASMIGNVAVIELTTGAVGSVDHTYDFGFTSVVPLGSIGNYVWTDANANGINDEPTSAGINGVKVYLCDASNAILDSTITANNGGNPGYYLFDSLVSGSYIVKFPTTNNNGGLTTATTTPATDNNSDANTTTGASPLVVIDANGVGVAKDNMTIDAGYYELASLGNYVWNDINHDGNQDANEVGVAGITVTLCNNVGTPIRTTITDAYGYYLFDQLIPGDYTVGFSLPQNYVFTTTSGTSESNAVNSDVNTTTGKTTTVNLSSGENQMNIDAGIYFQQPLIGSIGNYVWFDTNSDGVQDPNEVGISGVTVKLCNSTGTILATTITDANGNYIFTNLPAGNYSVGFTQPVGLIFSPSTGSINGTSNSDANPTTGKTSIIILGAGENITYVDAGLYPQPSSTASLGDRVWYDVNQNGIQDPTENGVVNVTVTLYASNGTTVLATTKTDAFGNYIFNDLTPAQYIVGFSSLPTNYVLTTNSVTNVTTNSDANPGTGMTPVITLDAGEHDMTWDAGIYTTIPTNTNSLGDYVWYDINKDGIQDVTERGVAGITVTLYDYTTNNPITTTSTNANGYYLFPDLPNGGYYVGFSNLPPNYSFSPSGIGGVNVDSDPNTSTGLTTSLFLTGNNNVRSLDAGIIAGNPNVGTASLGDKVWYDLNNDGLQNAGEAGVQGVTVTLYQLVGNLPITPIATTTTNALGYYVFTGLLPGDYEVGFTNLPAGYTISTKDADAQGIEGEFNSDVTISSQQTDPISLAIGQDKMSVDMGIVPPAGTASLGNFVWFDLNHDGLQTSGEPGVQGVSVALYDASGTQVSSTTTNADGEYYFIGLTPGTYSVGFANLPDGYTFTTFDANTTGINGSINSDANTTTGLTASVTLAVGDNNLNLDAGIISTTVASVGDYVWYDINHDGIQDPNEPGLGGILVTLYDNTNTPVASTITNPDGSYIFTNVIPGTYTMGFANLPFGMTFTTQESNPNSNTGSNADPSTGFTSSFTVIAGTHNPTIDAGLITTPLSGLGNYVWYDNNRDGLQNTNETGVAGVIATLFASDGTTVLSKAVTNGDGGYSFTNLPAETYQVGFSNLPQTYLATKSLGNLNDALNSDMSPIDGKTGFITLAIGEYNPNLDAGIVKPVAQLGNYVWNDINKDGIQNSTEVGVAGITVTLYDNLNTIIATTVTDAYGYYLFNPLPANTYHVGFTLPQNYVFTTSNAGTNDSTDSDVSPVNGLTGNYSLALGDSNMTVDAGIYFAQPSTASVGNFIWLDTNHDGIQDPGEQGISGVTVVLYNNIGNPVATTVTDANGFYLFTDVIPGNYSVGITPPVGYTISPNNGTVSNPSNSDINPSTGMTSIFTVNAGDAITYVDGGLYPLPTIVGGLGDKVWYDINQDGIQNTNELGVAGVTVTLYQDDGSTVLSTTTTDAFGNYIFNNLPAGNYIVGFSNIPAGYVLTNNSGTDSTTNSDANLLTGKTPIIALGAGQYNMTYDAGIYSNIPTNTNSIGNYVWFDGNKDGIQDSNEFGVPGVTVTLYDQSGTVLSTTSTNTSGLYLFPNLPNGTYHVGFSNLPLAAELSPTGQGTSTTDSDPNPSTGLTADVVLSGNTHDMTLDAGISLGNGSNVGLGSLGDRVWYDLDNDGLQDVGESGVPDVTVTLYGPDGTTVLGTTTTDPLGNYIFTGLTSGSYIVGFTDLPIGFTISPKNSDSQGINGESNSDVNSATGKTDIVLLGQGEDKMSVDMGINPPVNSASLGNFVWIDLNHDGLQTVGEPGVPGVTIKLYDINNDVIGVTTTDQNGEYYFVGLVPDTYSVGFENLPNGYTLTTFNADANGINGIANSDADPITGLTTTVTLAPGENNPNLDAGIASTLVASVGDYVWFDNNRNGLQDVTENGVGGVLVTLYDNDSIPVASAVTKPNGSYLFTNVTPGTYYVGFDNIPGGYIFTTSESDPNSNTGSNADTTTGLTPSFIVLPSTHNPTIDAGITPPLLAGLGDYVWIDVNENGQQDASEPAIPGVLVTLYASNATTVLASAITDGNGAYSFTNLPAGTYVVGFSNVPTIYGNTGNPLTAVPTTSNTGNDALDNDMGANGKTTTYTLVAGEFNPTIDAGFKYQIPLPVILEDFTARELDCKAELNWSTQSESNSSYFAIMRKSSTDNSFQEIGRVDAAGNSHTTTNYHFVDPNVVNGNYLYKLKMVDIDARYTFTNIENVTINCTTTQISVYPNPTSDWLTVKIQTEVSDDYFIKITDMSGRTIMETSTTVDEGVKLLRLDFSHVANGAYQITVTNSTETQVVRFQKVDGQ